MSNPDYYVSAVKYNSDNTHIAELKVHLVAADGTFKTLGITKTRSEIVKLIESRKTFFTVIKNGEKWNIGAEIRITTVATDYLKTVADKTTKDNLDNLPRF